MGGLSVAYQDRSKCHSSTCVGCLVRSGVWGIVWLLDKGLHFTGFRADVGEGVWRSISLFVLRLVAPYCSVSGGIYPLPTYTRCVSDERLGCLGVGSCGRKCPVRGAGGISNRAHSIKIIAIVIGYHTNPVDKVSNRLLSSHCSVEGFCMGCSEVVKK